MKTLYLFILIFSVAEATEFKSTQITPTLFMLEGDGGNITASIGNDGVLLVDVDFAEMSEKLILKLKARPRFIVNTHFHYSTKS